MTSLLVTDCLLNIVGEFCQDIVSQYVRLPEYHSYSLFSIWKQNISTHGLHWKQVHLKYTKGFFNITGKELQSHIEIGPQHCHLLDHNSLLVTCYFTQ